jgi:hypothetical protein
VTDALTKYVKYVPLPNKEAATVANAILDKWYCHFGAPLDIIKAKNFVLSYLMICSKDMAPTTLPCHLTIHSVTAKQKLPTRQLSSI